MLEISGEVCLKRGKRIIKTRDIEIAVRIDVILSLLVFYR
jgi:hypothetical protein